MNNQDKLKAIKEWQESGIVHQCTCKVGGHNHQDLVGKEIEDKIVLVCPDCGTVQQNVPEMIYTAYKNNSIKKTKEMFEKFMKGAIV